MGKLELTDRHFVEKFRRSIYVDDVATRSSDVDTAYEFYTKAKFNLAQASFNLRKFESNSPELQRRIQENELELYENQQSAPTPESLPRQVLGVNWDVLNDQLFFDIGNVAQQMNSKGMQSVLLPDSTTRWASSLPSQSDSRRSCVK